MSLHQNKAKLDDQDLEQTMENATVQETLGLILEVGKEFNREIRSVEKLGLYCVALNPRLTNAHQLREFSARAIERVPPNEECLKYDHLFSAEDPKNKALNISQVWSASTP
jgi:hypothetical protein